MAVLDAAAVLMSGTFSTSQSFAPISVYPRQLATSMVEIHLTTPPVASATFTVEVASTAGGTYSPISTLVWPAGRSGAQQVPLGVSASVARLNTTSLWMRLSLTTSGSLTGTAYLTKATDGPGLGIEPGDLVPAL